MSFDWNDHPIVKEDANKTKGFNWDDHPIVKQNEDYKNDLTYQALEGLPLAGMAVGGGVGLATSAGLGSVPLAGLGAMGGESLKRGLKGLLYPQENQGGMVDIANSQMKSFNEGATGEMGGQILGKGLEVASPYISKITNPVSEYVGDKLSPIGDWATKNANEKAVKVLNHTAKFTKLAERSPEKLQELGQMLRDSGDVGAFSTPSSVSEKLAARADTAGANIGNITNEIKGVEGAPKIDLSKIAADLRARPEFQAMELTPGMEGTYAKANNALDTLAKNGKVDFDTGLTRRRGIDKSIKEFRFTGENNMGDHLLDQRNAIANDLTSTADELANSGQVGFNSGDLKAANKQFSQYSTAEDLAGTQAAKDARNRGMSLTDYMASLAGLAKGGPPLAVGLGIGNKVARTFGNGIQMKGYSALESALSSSPQMALLAKQSPEIFKAFVQNMQSKLDNQQEPKQLTNKDSILQKTQGSKYSQVLQNAAQKGDNSFNAAHFILSQNNADYRKQLEDEEK